MRPIDWNPDIIKVGYARRVVGFDVRIDPKASMAKSSDADYAGTWNKTRPLCLSVDPLIWPRFYKEDGHDTENALGFIDDKDTLNKLLNKDSRQKIIAAFDMPDNLVTVAEPQLAIHPLTMSALNGFSFCGFDVAEWCSNSSGFYSVDWSIEDMNLFLDDNDLRLNAFGLMDTESEAIRAAQALTKRIPSHAPFAPVGIWIRKSSEKDFFLNP